MGVSEVAVGTTPSTIRFCAELDAAGRLMLPRGQARSFLLAKRNVEGILGFREAARRIEIYG